MRNDESAPLTYFFTHHITNVSNIALVAVIFSISQKRGANSCTAVWNIPVDCAQGKRADVNVSCVLLNASFVGELQT